MMRPRGKRPRRETEGKRAELAKACDACAQLLLPIASRFSNEGIGINLFVQIAKHAYVRSSARDMKVAGQRPSISRIAALTGLNRREIKQLVQASSQQITADRVTPVMRVVLGWQTDHDFVTRSGAPRILTTEGPRSFRELVRRHAGDVTHVALLREMLRLKWVARSEVGKLTLMHAPAAKSSRLTARELANRLSAYAAALETSDAGSSFSGFGEFELADPKVRAVLMRDFSKRAQHLLLGIKRRAAHTQASCHSSEGNAPVSVGFFLTDTPQTRFSDAYLEPPTKPTRRAKRA